MRILDVGCGRNKTPDAIGIDRVKLPGVDIIADVGTSPLPFKKAVFDKIICRHMFEHLRSERRIDLLREFYHLLKESGTIEITVPHRSCYKAALDPTHKDIDSLILDMFDYFSRSHKFNYYFDFGFKTVATEITNVGVHFPNRKLVNKGIIKPGFFRSRFYFLCDSFILKIARRWEPILHIVPTYSVSMKFVLEKEED